LASEIGEAVKKRRSEAKVKRKEIRREGGRG
jgi:hypothetical protein